MMRSCKLCLLFCFAVVPAHISRAAAAQPGQPPNIILILADDLGAADLGCYGADLHETPRIDRLAAEGVRFTQAYASAPVCTPTRAAIMTGKHPARLHMTIWYEAAVKPPPGRRLVPPPVIGNLPHEETTLAELLQAHGYLTALVGKWHLGDAAHYPETQGFAINIGGTFWGAPDTYFWPYRGSGSFKEFRYVPHLEWGREGEYLTDRLTEEALAIMERASDRPFFLYLAHHTPHTPIEAKPPLIERYTAKLGPGMHHTNPVYAAMVHSFDDSVGRIVDRLEQLGLAERTMLIVTSDNGGYVNEHRGRTVTSNFPLRSGKGSLYEGGIRVPLIVRFPGTVPAAAQCAEPVASADLFATVLEAAGVAFPADQDADRDGVSLLPLLRQPEGKLNRPILAWHYPHYYPTTTPVSAVRSGNWKLLEYHEDMRVELYDLANDPSEEHDLAAERPERAEELRERLHDWRAEVGAQMPSPR